MPMRPFTTQQTEDLIFDSYHQRTPLYGDDADTRDLSPIIALYGRAGITPNKFPTITITGSKGKGSTAIFASVLLQGMGINVGLITSPNLVHHRERIRLNGHAIPESDYNRIATQLAPHIRAIQNRLKPTQYMSPNGIFIAIAMRYFMEQDVQAMVLEAGRGGRFDEASFFVNQVAVITRIDHEHTAQLGNTLERIAWHKAGIIQATSQVVTGDISEAPMHIIEQEIASTGARHFQQDTIRCQMATLPDLPTFQQHNLAVAERAVHALMPEKGDDAWQKACAILPHVRLHGRAQKISDDPPTWVDGAIHRAGAEAFLQATRNPEHGETKKRILLGAFPADKDGAGVLDTLEQYVNAIKLTQPENGYLRYDDDILTHAQKTHPEAHLVPDVDKAIEFAVAQTKAIQGELWIVGTQSLVRAAPAHFDIDTTTIIAIDKKP
jgi:dihydrofolate synthase/folylpolyglutamate synthase